jgi:hypothetical protein
MDLQWALNQTWDTIAADIMECAGVDIMDRDEVVEIVLNANYLEMYGGLDKETLAEFRAKPYDEQVKLATKAFTYARYGA